MKRRDFLRALSVLGVATAARVHAQNNLTGAASLAHDPDRPDFHLLPPHNWMNDPNGPIFWQGRYHLFYQLNPGAAVWGDMHWGHAISADMIHWQPEAIALAPTPGGDDREGCFSGSATILNGKPVFIYTGVKRVLHEEATILDTNHDLRECQLMATALDDSLNHWKKFERPILAAPPREIAATGFRDPCIWFENGEWWLVVGSGMRGIGGCALLYRAKKNSNLTEWEYLHPLAIGKKNQKTWPTTAENTVDSGEMWECPDFFALGNSRCLLYSTEGKVQWHTGGYSNQRFNPQHSGILDHGAYYAPKSFVAPDGRRILWGWIQETRSEAEYARAGWSGVMSLPRALTMSKTGNLQMQPAAEVDSLRIREEGFVLDQSTQRSHMLGSLLWEFLITDLTSEQSLEFILVQHGKKMWSVAIDGRTRTARCGESTFTVRLDESPTLRLFLDGSVIESFFGLSEVCTSRIYGLLPGECSYQMNLQGPGNLQCKLFPMRPISPDKMTTEFQAS